jgi:hypothetical protein
VILVAFCITIIILLRQLNRRIKEFQAKTADQATTVKLGQQVARIRAQVEETDRLVRLPVLTGLKVVKLGNHEVRVRAYTIPDKPVSDWADQRELPPPDWDPSSPTLPFPYPSRSARGEIRYEGRPFHPYYFEMNVTALCNYAAVNGSLAQARPVIDRLVADLQANLRPSGSALFVGYPFSFKLKDDQQLDSGWVSAFGNAEALCAMVTLYHKTKDPNHKSLAKKLAAAFLQICNNPKQEEPWVSFVDANDFLWFEEYPCRTKDQPRVFNGHVFALMALDYYRAIAEEDREDIVLLLRAGITTMHRYISEYRRPGQVNRYALLAPLDVPDYCPSRTIMYVDWLARVSGDPYFASMADAFRTDQH